MEEEGFFKEREVDSLSHHTNVLLVIVSDGHVSWLIAQSRQVMVDQRGSSISSLRCSRVTQDFAESIDR